MISVILHAGQTFNEAMIWLGIIIVVVLLVRWFLRWIMKP